MSTEHKPTYEVLIPIYPGVNTLDVNGPLEVLCNSSLRGEGYAPFKITIAAKEEHVKAYEFITLKPDIRFEGAGGAIENIKAGKYDILLVPGAPSAIIIDIIDDKNAQILQVIKAFIDHDPKKALEDLEAENDQKWLFSVCTGAFLVGAAGGFKDRDATTHFGGLDTLRKICQEAGAPAKSVERKRWVKGEPLTAEGQKIPTKILSSGGISCGLDASLWLVRQLVGGGAAYEVAETMDYNWNIVWPTTTVKQGL